MDADHGRMPWRARIRSADGRVLGGGVLLGTGHVLTCAHVLRNAGAAPLVDFIGLPEAPPVVARVSADGWNQPDPDGQGDVALLALDGQQPAGLGAELYRKPLGRGRSVHVYGFPRFSEVGLWAPATLAAWDGEWMLLEAAAEHVLPGFSGGPVLDDETGRLLGILTGTTDEGTFRMVPAVTILEYLPQVAEWIGPDSAVLESLDRLVVKVGSLPSHRYDDLLVSLPKGELPDLTNRLLDDPIVPEDRRFCSSCASPVGRSGLVRGFCARCRTPFDFTPGLRPGDVIGQYEVLGCIARGGFSWIYLAASPQVAGGYVVLKELMTAEHAILATLDHPNLVRVLGFAEHADAGYLVMEDVPGPSLREVLARARRLRPEQVAAYGREILAALGYLHSQGLVYTDMKPDNVIQTGDRIKLIDLSSVRLIGDRRSPIVGTPGYHAEEDEIAAHGLTVRSDIYSVGKTLRALLRHGPQTDSLGEESLFHVAERAVAPYDRRFGTVAEMSEQLDGVLREILSLRDRIPRPAPSTVFAAAAVLLDAGLGDMPRVSDLRGNLQADCPPPPAAAAALPAISPDLADSEPARQWNAGLALLADGVVDKEPFRACFHAVPGELAPKLALGYCAEFSGDETSAERFYEAVWVRDRAQVSAAFGLARVRLRRGDRLGAAAVLDEVPDSSEHYLQAQIAAVRALFIPGSRLPDPKLLAAAMRRIRSLELDIQAEDCLRIAVLEVALAARLAMDTGENERQMRDRLSGAYRRLALSASPAERRFLYARAAAVRPRFRWFPGQTREAAFEVSVDYDKYLTPGQDQVQVLLSMVAVRAVRDVEMAFTPDRSLPAVEQVATGFRQVRRANPVALGHWKRGERREYRLTFATQQGDRPLPLSTVDLTVRKD